MEEIAHNPAPVALARSLIYQSRWVNLYLDKVQFPNGQIIEKHHLLDFDHQAVMIVAQNTEGQFLMVKVCRYPSQSTAWEFPAGGMEDDESVPEAGLRELLEEGGYHADTPSILYSFFPMNGIANKVFHIVRCTVTDYVGLTDTAEISATSWVSAETIWSMIRAHEIIDGYTLIAFMLSQHI